MLLKTRILVIVAIALSAFAQITLKYGMSRPQVQKALESMHYPALATAVCLNAGVVGGLVMYVGSMAFWLFVLAEMDVSQAYPFVGLGILLTSFFGYFFLGESMNTYKIAGALLVASGIILLSFK
jgi:multidrug transporter EmrE-like cation transporter